MPRAVQCRVGKETISIREALRRRKSQGRFVGQGLECGEDVRAHKESKHGGAHFEHLRRNPACSLSDPHRS